MAQRREAITQHLAVRLCGQVARRHDSREARRLDRKPVVDGVDRLDEGAWRDDYFSFQHELGRAPSWARSKVRRASARWCRSSSPACSIA